MRTSAIYVSTSVNALHYWPNAPEGRWYLGHEHRHRFHIKAWALVKHNDRDIEFHDLQALLDDAIQGALVSDSKRAPSFGGRSCETIATRILDVMPPAVWRVEVQEDEDCGAIVERQD